MRTDEVRRRMVYSAHDRSKRAGLPCTITHVDFEIPAHCPVLGIPLFRGVKHLCDNSPTLDRIVPQLGYVPGNIKVISLRANRIRSNATSEDLLKVYGYSVQLDTNPVSSGQASELDTTQIVGQR